MEIILYLDSIIPTPTRRVACRLSEALIGELAIEAAARHLPMNTIIAEAIRIYTRRASRRRALKFTRLGS